jgi:transposase
MSRRKGQNSAATERALKLVSQGMTRYAAARKVGIALSTVYRAAKLKGTQ